MAFRDLAERSILKFTGEDRVSFLHGMVTQDVKGLSENKADYTAVLNAKGGMIADGKISRLSTCLLLDTESRLGARVKETLEKFIIADDVEIEDGSQEFALLQLWGPESSLLVEQIQGVKLAVKNPLGRLPRVDLLILSEDHDSVQEQILRQGAPLGLETLTPETAHILRIEEGIPLYGPEMNETTLPLEANLERAISYNKGCYIGQEVIARATFRGQVNWRLTGFTLEEPPGPLPLELRIEDRKVGWISSVAKSPAFQPWIALGYLHRNHFELGRAVPLAGGQAFATVQALPFNSG